MFLFMKRGNRECHLVVLQDDDTVQWDEDYPPNMGEEFVESKYAKFVVNFYLDIWVIILDLKPDPST